MAAVAYHVRADRQREAVEEAEAVHSLRGGRKEEVQADGARKEDQVGGDRKEEDQVGGGRTDGGAEDRERLRHEFQRKTVPDGRDMEGSESRACCRRDGGEGRD